ncbi:hypothetical protein [Myceligenerans salitolerans]|uniref:Phage holin family protein n=1 Tax=Myceligenerans salitolerans TaxID=1230528 RepID=A0ABS3IDP6_9MICO|nr:hypothetical protein [Myceligenerans salitolerans]MBO0611100.1 hypothetical protein [Myceligenerans salitolerans]
MTTTPTPHELDQLAATELAELREDVRLARLILGRIRQAASRAGWGIAAGVAGTGIAIFTGTGWLADLAAAVALFSLLAVIGLTLLAAFLGDPPDPEADDRLAAWWPDDDHDHDDAPDEDPADPRRGSADPRYR